MHIAKNSLAGLAAALALVSSPAFAEEHVVKAQVTKFVPMVVFAAPGDTITWTNMTGHDTTNLEGMIPEGAEEWQSKMGENYTITVDKDGAYIYQCTPHASLGMQGIIVVGESAPANLEAIKNDPRNKGMVARAIRKLDKELEAKGL